MARRLKWAESAWDDLEEAADYIARDSAGYAAAFVQEVRDAARSLRQFSERGRIVPELGDPSLREIFVQGYRMIYRVTAEVVHIVGIIHRARDLRAVWERQGRGGSGGSGS